jgi:hypothetical protein
VSKRDAIEADDAENERTEWGTALQQTIAQKFAEKNAVKVRAINGYADAGDGMGASFDYQIIGRLGDSPIAELYLEHGHGILEIKNVDTWVFKNEWTDEAPAHIEIQVQHQLEACQREWAVLAVLVGGNRLETFVRRRDREVGLSLRQRIGKFWSDLASGTLPPVVLPRDAAIVASLYRHANAGEVMDAQGNETVRDICLQYEAASHAEKAASDMKATCKALLLPLIGTAEKVLVDGYTVSCGEVPEKEIAYTRKAYRNFRITPKGTKRDSITQVASHAITREESLRSGSPEVGDRVGVPILLGGTSR